MSPLPPERWTEANRIFHNALAYPADTRMTYVSDVCGADADLRDEVQALLSYHERADSMADPASEPTAPNPLDLAIDVPDWPEHAPDDSVVPLPAAAAPDAPRAGFFTPLWWWQLEQVLMLVGYGIAAYLLWGLSQTTGTPTDHWLFLGGISAALLANTLRGRLWLTSVWEASQWRATRLRTWAGLRLADGVLGMTLLAAGAMHRLDQPPLATALVGASVFVLALFLLVEPALSRAVK